MNDSQSFREYGAVVIRDSLAKMLLHLDGVMAGETSEPVHKMRVASRRLRAALSVFAPAFPTHSFAKFENEIKLVTDALGDARDLDVMVSGLEALDLLLPESDRSMLENFIATKVAQRKNRQKRVQSALERIGKIGLSEQWEKIATNGQCRVQLNEDILKDSEANQSLDAEIGVENDEELQVAIHSILIDSQIFERTKH